MEGSDPKEKLNSTYFEALKKNWMLWPAVQAINFKFVPLEHRVLVVNIVSLGKRTLSVEIGMAGLTRSLRMELLPELGKQPRGQEE